MTEKLRAAALAVLEVLSEDDRNADKCIRILEDALAEPEEKLLSVHRLNQWLKVSFAEQEPEKREWVGLTDDEINAIEFPQSGTATMRDFVRIIEAKLREKNGG